ncbi:MAG: hypothetical protein COT17_02445 [Elusimicrobia bacterium CG08_land_8_20_14_0_20_51_18]|nr:MAG: hypothetical protein COT17_02445 [Elusimicrobia bacterium CG08_land_8_20_14_0_20_51_18]
MEKNPIFPRLRLMPFALCLLPGVFILFFSHPSFSQEPSVSSGTAPLRPQVPACPLGAAREAMPTAGTAPSTAPFGSSSLNFIIDRRSDESSVHMNYSLRWDFKDLKRAYLLPGLFYRDASRLDLRKNVKLRYYGYKISPFKFFISERKMDVPGAGGEQVKDPAPGEKPGKRLRFSLSPLYDDLMENADDFLLDNSFKSLSPEWEKLSRTEKKSFFRDVLRLEMWDYPLFRGTSEGLEKISD